MAKYVKGAIIACIAIAILAMFTACGSSSSSTPAPVVTVTESYDPMTDPLVDEFTLAEEKFINVIHGDNSGNQILANADNVSLLDAGYAVCEAFDNGYTSDEIVAYFVGNVEMTGQEAYAYGYIIGAAATTLCPEYAYQVA